MTGIPLSQMAAEGGSQNGQEATPPQQAVPAAGVPATPPAQNEPPQAAETPAAPEPPKTMKVRFRHEDVELPIEKVVEFAQRGMSASKLEERREELQAEAQRNKDFVEAGRFMSEFAARDPERFRMVQELVAGRDPFPQRQAGGVDEDLDEGLTPRQPAPTVPFELEQRMARLEAGLDKTVRSSRQRDQQEALNRAISSNDFLRANPEAADLARSRIEAAVASGDFASYDDAAAVIGSTVKSMTDAMLERELAAREERRAGAIPRSSDGSPVMPRLDREVATYKNHKSGKGREALRSWITNVRSTITGSSQTP